MEDIVNLPGFWKFQLVSEWTEDLNDFEGSFPLGCHLFVIGSLEVS